MNKRCALLLVMFLIMGYTATRTQNGNSQKTTSKRQIKGPFTLSSTVGQVERDAAFKDFGRLLFPVDQNVSRNATLKGISNDSVYMWYTEIHPQKIVEIVNTLKNRVMKRHQKIFYNIYSQKERQKDVSKRNTGLFYFKGKTNRPYAIVNVGGGFLYVGAMHDSFPVALELSKKGYNAFALIYRDDHAYEDLAQAKAVVTQYTGYDRVDRYDAPTYANVGTDDGIASYEVMRDRMKALKRLHINSQIHIYKGLEHGFGLGIDTVAEGWVDEAIRFIKKQK